VLPFFGGLTPDPTHSDAAEGTARRIARATGRLDRTLVAMVDGDGDRLVLFTNASGLIGSAEQVALLMAHGLPVRHLLTSVVAPRMLREVAADRRDAVTVTRVGVGFKHQVAQWREHRGGGTLAVEPNGAFVWSGDSGAYFERDSLAALAVLLNVFTGIDDLDAAVASHRKRHPYAQRILSVAQPADKVLDRMARLRSGWRRESVAAGVASFDGGRPVTSTSGHPAPNRSPGSMSRRRTPR
jgi:phosphomannomutase